MERVYMVKAQIPATEPEVLQVGGKMELLGLGTT